MAASKREPRKRLRPPGTVASPLLSRPPLERITIIHSRIRGGKYPNCRQLSEQLDVSQKTIMRDIEFMRDRLRLPIEYHPAQHGFYYSEPVSNVVGLDVSEGEVVALLIAQKALHQHRGTAFEAPLRSACAKLEASLGGTVSVDLVELDKAISFRETGVTQVDPEVFEAVSKAATSCRELSFSYLKLKADTPEPRRCQPYHLACINNQWYLFAHDLGRNDLRTFVLARMSAVSVLTKTFKRPQNFSIDELLANSLDVFRGDGQSREIRVRFDSWAARLVRERLWHSSQRLENLPDGGCEVSLQLSSLEEVERWILGYAGHARAVAPPELVERLRCAVAQLSAMYAP
jgi:predicted DNA-binding transcriptional regulator YafY